MPSRLATQWAVTGTTIAVLSSVACVQLSGVRLPSVGESVTEPSTAGSRIGSSADSEGGIIIAPTNGMAVVPGFQTMLPRRGSISERLTLTGRIGAQRETPAGFTIGGRLETLSVQPGEFVEKDQLLAELGSRDVKREVTAARGRLDLAVARLEKAKLDLQAKLKSATDNLDRLRVGPSPADRRGAEGYVATAQAALIRAEADLARLVGGPNPADVRVAEQDVATAMIALQTAEAELDQLKNGPNINDLRFAENQFASAENSYQRAVAELELRTRGADPYDVRLAERAVAQAESDLRAAQSAPTGSGSGGSAAKAANIQRARYGLETAQDNLAKIKTGPKPWEVETAQRNVEITKRTLDDARERLAVARAGATQLTVSAASAKVEAARIGVEKAQIRHQEVLAGPAPDQVAAAKAAVVGARASLDGALARLSEVDNPKPRPEVAEAEARVAVLRAVLDGRPIDPAYAGVADSDNNDLILLQKTVEQQQAQLEAVERDLAATTLVAPFSGVVVALSSRIGDQVEPGRPVLMMAEQSEPLVRAMVSETDAARLRTGQSASLRVDGSDVGPFTASVADPTITGAGSSVKLDVAWSDFQPALGATVQISVLLRENPNALLVPERALRQSSQTPYLEVLDQGIRRTTTVQTGIIAGGEVEIVSGLEENQVVVLPVTTTDSQPLAADISTQTSP